MRTLSARILLGFAALTITFGVITGTVVFNMQKVEDEIRIERQGFVALALEAKTLGLVQQNLWTYLDKQLEDEPSSDVARKNLMRVKTRRDTQFTKASRVLDEADDTTKAHLEWTKPMLAKIREEIAAIDELYVKVLAAPPLKVVAAGSDELRALGLLRDSERRVSTDAEQLSTNLERRVRETMLKVEENEHTVRLATIYLGLVAVALGLLVTTWVVITLRPLRRLRDAARRVAAGRYDERVDERGPTEVRELARELNTMAHAVEERERKLVRSEKLAAISTMAAMITHEVRNPLSSIGLNTELLEEELAEIKAGDEARQLCTAIHREVDRLTEITEHYLAFSKLPKPKIGRENVNAMARALADFVREDLAVKKVELVSELAADDPLALIDAAQIRQCLVNLVNNAADAVVAKGGGKVTLRTRRSGERVVIEVEDDGVGIPSDVLPKLFDPFFSTKESGSGLGLALTQQIVRDHGGDISVASDVGRGTTFTVGVPAAV
jgi:signal transduction histidine kinase